MLRPCSPSGHSRTPKPFWTRLPVPLKVCCHAAHLACAKHQPIQVGPALPLSAHYASAHYAYSAPYLTTVLRVQPAYRPAFTPDQGHKRWWCWLALQLEGKQLCANPFSKRLDTLSLIGTLVRPLIPLLFPAVTRPRAYRFFSVLRPFCQPLSPANSQKLAARQS